MMEATLRYLVLMILDAPEYLELEGGHSGYKLVKTSIA